MVRASRQTYRMAHPLVTPAATSESAAACYSLRTIRSNGFLLRMHRRFGERRSGTGERRILRVDSGHAILATYVLNAGADTARRRPLAGPPALRSYRPRASYSPA